MLINLKVLDTQRDKIRTRMTFIIILTKLGAPTRPSEHRSGFVLHSTPPGASPLWLPDRPPPCELLEDDVPE